MGYAVPGRADELSPDLVERWNERIRARFDALADELKSRFFDLEFERLADPSLTRAVKWPGDPAEPRFCADTKVAQALSDWGIAGRHALHNEYCEYAVIHATDASGKARPKRVEVTTELREYWLLIARNDPARVQQMAAASLEREVTFDDLYGVSDPESMSPADREVAFAHTVAGNGFDPAMEEAQVPEQPTGRLNAERALFMTHPINGLDDLLFIVLFGSLPYARRSDEGIERASSDDIFAAAGSPELACRHADPAAAIEAYEVAFEGGQVAFADPLGMYIREPNVEVFLFEGEPVPERWVRFGRGEAGMRQRLVFGPGDDEDAFLDDIVVAVGASESPMLGGYQLVRELEIGPLILVANGPSVDASEFRIVERAARIECASSDACATVDALKRDFEAQQRTRVGPRRLGPA